MGSGAPPPKTNPRPVSINRIEKVVVGQVEGAGLDAAVVKVPLGDPIVDRPKARAVAENGVAVAQLVPVDRRLDVTQGAQEVARVRQIHFHEGVGKAALEGIVKYPAAELWHKQIRVNALSPGPLRTRAASSLAHFDKIIDEARSRAPKRRLVTIEDVGNMAAGLVGDDARNGTGNIAFIDAGYHITS